MMTKEQVAFMLNRYKYQKTVTKILPITVSVFFLAVLYLAYKVEVAEEKIIKLQQHALEFHNTTS